jgi:hypothetical protein
LLDAVGALDADAATAEFARDGRLWVAHGRRADGADAVHALMAEFLATLRSVSYRITDHWRVADAWIAEFEAEYELRDRMQTGPLPRAMILRDGPNGIEDVHVYGANETDPGGHPTGEEGSWIGGRWMPPL